MRSFGALSLREAHVRSDREELCAERPRADVGTMWHAERVGARWPVSRQSSWLPSPPPSGPWYWIEQAIEWSGVSLAEGWLQKEAKSLLSIVSEWAASTMAVPIAEGVRALALSVPAKSRATAAKTLEPSVLSMSVASFARSSSTPSVTSATPVVIPTTT